MENIEKQLAELENNGAKLEDMLRFSKNSGKWSKVIN